MKPDERRERIAALVREANRVSVDELAALLGTSRETVRRDLSLLSEQGIVRKVHGGAVHSQTALESPLGDRRATARLEKIAIGRTAAALLRDGDSVLVDTGSTTTYFAEELGKTGRYTVITNSTLVAGELWNAPHRSQVHLLGGQYNGDGYQILGPQVVDQIKRIYADHAVLTVGAIDPTGTCMDFNADEAYIAQAMIASARQVTILADSRKLGRHALFQVCGPEKIHRLVTDRAPEPAVASALRMAGVEIVIAASVT